MKVQPIKNYKSPNYPLKEQVLHNHKLLQKLPQRWKTNVFVCTAVSSLSLFMLTTFSGCVTRTAGTAPYPNITLTEDEAILIINEEALKQGTTFSNNEKKSISIDLPTSTTIVDGICTFNMAHSTLELDGFNIEKNVGYEYISDTDAKTLLGEQYSASDNAIKQLSNNLTENLHKNKSEIKANVFYSSHFASEKAAEDNLRTQVNDFIMWLKGQGII